MPQSKSTSSAHAPTTNDTPRPDKVTLDDVHPFGVNEASPDPDAITQKQQDDFNNQANNIALEMKRYELTTRKWLTSRIWVLTIVWLVVVLVIFVLSGLRVLIYNDKVMMALLGTTTVSVMGFLYTVVSHIFPKHRK